MRYVLIFTLALLSTSALVGVVAPSRCAPTASASAHPRDGHRVALRAR